MLFRSVVICDEIATCDDTDAIQSLFNAGIPVIATAHAGSYTQLCRKTEIKRLIDGKAVSNIVILNSYTTRHRIAELICDKKFAEVVMN